MNAPLTRDALSPDQLDAFERIGDWIRAPRKPILTLGGFAGTGKTTLLATFALSANVSPIAFVAYTGKAASVLGRKLREAGVDTVNQLRTPKGPGAALSQFGGPPYCGTIHSLIYKPCDCMTPRARGAEPVKRPCVLCNEKRWMLREELDRSYNLIVIDEASMVSDDMLADLRTFTIPMLAVGDHGQLPPIRGVGGLMRAPEIRLERIHRQAEKNPIIALSKCIRETGDFSAKLADGKAVRFGTMRDMRSEVAMRFEGVRGEDLFDQALICYTNKRRVGLNQLARQARGLHGAPNQGEQVICLRNMRRLGVHNGMRGLLSSPAVCRNEEQAPWLYEATISFPEEGLRPQLFEMCGVQFNREKTIDDVDVAREEYGLDAYSWERLGSLFDFGYAMTCHKVQGSQFSDVLVIAETWGMDAETSMRWKYTATTRAAQTLTVLR